jgi:hypothetical protein
MYIDGRFSASYEAKSVVNTAKDKQVLAIHWSKDIPRIVGSKAVVQLVWTIEVAEDSSLSGTHSEVGQPPYKFLATWLDAPAR